jgi:hypothetical protein
MRIDGVPWKIVVHALEAQVKNVIFLETALIGQMNFIFIRYF